MSEKILNEKKVIEELTAKRSDYRSQQKIYEDKKAELQGTISELEEKYNIDALSDATKEKILDVIEEVKENISEIDIEIKELNKKIKEINEIINPAPEPPSKNAEEPKKSTNDSTKTVKSDVSSGFSEIGKMIDKITDTVHSALSNIKIPEITIPPIPDIKIPEIHVFEPDKKDDGDKRN